MLELKSRARKLGDVTPSLKKHTQKIIDLLEQRALQQEFEHIQNYVQEKNDITHIIGSGVEKIQQIGSGFFATVWRGTWNGAPVAIKVIQKDADLKEVELLRYQKTNLTHTAESCAILIFWNSFM